MADLYISLVRRYVYGVRRWKTELAGKNTNIFKILYEIFLQWNTIFFLQKVTGVLHFESCQNYTSSANLAGELCTYVHMYTFNTP